MTGDGIKYTHTHTHTHASIYTYSRKDTDIIADDLDTLYTNVRVVMYRVVLKYSTIPNATTVTSFA